MLVRQVYAVAALALFASIARQAQGAPQQSARPTPVQPIAYSHRLHVALGLQCRGCHVNPDAGKLMTYPATATCMACHRSVAVDRPSIRALASFAASEKPVPWVRVYRLPDYVFWKHSTHLLPDITCVDCHGPVAERDVVAEETNITTMEGCVACHDKRQVFTDCGDCHEPRR